MSTIGGKYMRKSSEVSTSKKEKYFGWLTKGRQTAMHNCLIIGIDFGTTFSGVSWVTVARFNKDDINVITDWPGTSNDEAKVPTRLSYENRAKEPLWGFQVDNTGPAVQWFKLLLLKEEDMWKDLRESEQLIKVKKLLRDWGKTAEDCIADYLRALWRHTLKMIRKGHADYLIETLQFHVVLTVPAIWKDYARTAMQEAAKNAGILEYRSAGETTLILAPEPEAAALTALLEYGTNISPGEVYVICDAGGGTVDVITYKVVDTQPLELGEAVEGDGEPVLFSAHFGALCGGIFIDEDFITKCSKRIGRKWSHFSQAHQNAILEDEWEVDIKPRFSLRDPRAKWLLSIENGPLSGADLQDTSRMPHIKRGIIHFSRKSTHYLPSTNFIFSSDIREVFDARATPGLLELVGTQIDKAQDKGLSVTGIILVGGLGCSDYLFESLEAKYDSQGIDIYRSEDKDQVRSAICRGAILKGLIAAPIDGYIPNAPRILSTISRTSLGIPMIYDFQEGVHRKKNRFFDEVEGCYKVRDVMQWYIKRGNEVETDRPIRKNMYRSRSMEDSLPSSLDFSIYQCESEYPPKYKTHVVTLHSTIEFQLGHFGYSAWEVHGTSSGRRFQKLCYTLEMVPSGASTEISVWINGQRLGSEYISIQFD
ncbi:hypothetical protein N7537_006922 [Penicillium hordei]|uniref:Uncharacterized protein n=1 Tax=Penicillium hordei TaxID=40994 RepID=A0AAD6E8Q7_9EURO|nr:uncharacterized protein N7537_006922 [Penicillium hordei]KAJ5603966.1 hypothetical protein N7537_006922 [Penicillium hordei]